MEIREITDDELQEAYYLGTQAFGHGERDDNFAENRRKDPNRLPSTSYGIWDAEGLQAKATVIHYQQQFGPNCVFSMGGIAGVVSLPASRGRGYAGKILRHTLEQMREKGEFVSDLFPFSWEFYGRLGWAWVGKRSDYVVTTRVFQTDKGTANVRAARPADRAAINACYTAYAGRYRGLIVRDERFWNRILDDGDREYTYTYLYEQDGHVEGYLTFRGWKREETRLREFVALTPQAQRGLLGLLRRHEMQVENFAWSAPEDDALWHQVYHWDMKTQTRPVTMARIVDVPTALMAWKPDAVISGAVVLRVLDTTAPWNNATWRLEFGAGEAAISPIQTQPDLTLDIQALSQAYHGTPNLDSLRQGGRLEVHSETGYEALRQFLDGPPMWMNDSF